MPGDDLGSSCEGKVNYARGGGGCEVKTDTLAVLASGAACVRAAELAHHHLRPLVPGSNIN